MTRCLVCILSIIALAACAGHTIPPRGEPIRVGLKDNKGEGKATLHEIPLERYVASVLAKEVRSDWPLEALKAQAVATRTYAVYRKQNPRNARFDVLSDTSDQVYEKANRHPSSIVQAVTETEGEVLETSGKVLEAFFHSCCGGKSESADQVWPGSHPSALLAVHEDPYCNACPPAHWEYRISRQELAALLTSGGYAVGDGWKAEVTKRDPSGRVLDLTFLAGQDKTVVPGTKFRQLVGNGNLKSTLFDLSAADGDEETIVFSGQGAGHGVGLCQWGSKGMAEAGKTYREILEFYYPGAEISGNQSKDIMNGERSPFGLNDVTPE